MKDKSYRENCMMSWGSIFTAIKMDLAWCMKKVVGIAPDIAEKLNKTIVYVNKGIAAMPMAGLSFWRPWVIRPPAC